LSAVGGNVSIARNQSLSSLNQWDRLDFVGGSLEILDNPALSGADAWIDRIGTISGTVTVAGNQ
jgi:hypothetical protein